MNENKPLPEPDLKEIIQATADLWPAAKNASFFFTGATGFFGFWLIESFCRANDELGLGMHATLLSRNPDNFLNRAPYLSQRKDLEFIQGDMVDFKIPEKEFNYIVHAATDVATPSSSDAATACSIIDGTRRVMHLCELAKPERMLLMSSGGIYGVQPTSEKLVSETFPGAPDPTKKGSGYGEGKRISELIAISESERLGVHTSIARGFAFSGPRLPLNAHLALGNFIRDALNGGPIRIGGDGTPIRSYLYGADLAIWLWSILFTGHKGRAYNVGSDRLVSIHELACQVAEVISPECEILLGSQPDPNKPPARYAPDVTLAKNELQLEELVSLKEGLSRTLAWLRA